MSAEAAETPTDTAPGEAKEPRPKVPQRGIRRRVLGDGEGDFCIYEIAPPSASYPRGTLMPIPGTPRFSDTGSALRWLKNESGDLLAGKQIMIFRACEILTLHVQQKPTVVIESKPKIVVHDPSKAETSDE